MWTPSPMKPETIERRRIERANELAERRASFIANVEQAKLAYPQFPYPETLPESNSLWLEGISTRGPKGYTDAISISANGVKYDPAF